MNSYREHPKDFSEFDALAEQLNETFTILCKKQIALKSTYLTIEYSTNTDNEIKSYYYRLSSMGPMSNWITKINMVSSFYYWLYFKFKHEDEIYFTLTTDLGMEKFQKCVDRMSNAIGQIIEHYYDYNNVPLIMLEDKYTKPLRLKSKNYYMQHYLTRHGFSISSFKKRQHIPAIPKNSFL